MTSSWWRGRRMSLALVAAIAFSLGTWAGFIVARWMAATDRLADLEMLAEDPAQMPVARTLPSAESSAAPKADWRSAERTLDSVITETDIERFLAAVEIPGFFAEARDSRPVGRRSPILTQSAGRFEGKVDFIDGTHRSWDMTLTIGEDGVKATVVEAGRSIGEVELRGNGMGRGFRRFAKGSRGFLLSLDDVSRFQLYRMVSKAQFIGNFYYQDSVGLYKIRARAQLERKQP